MSRYKQLVCVHSSSSMLATCTPRSRQNEVVTVLQRCLFLLDIYVFAHAVPSAWSAPFPFLHPVCYLNLHSIPSLSIMSSSSLSMPPPSQHSIPDRVEVPPLLIVPMSLESSLPKDFSHQDISVYFPTVCRGLGPFYPLLV